MTTTGKNWSNHTKTYISVTLSTTPTGSGLGLNLGLGDTMASDYLQDPWGGVSLVFIPMLLLPVQFYIKIIHISCFHTVHWFNNVPLHGHDQKFFPKNKFLYSKVIILTYQWRWHNSGWNTNRRYTLLFYYTLYDIHFYFNLPIYWHIQNLYHLIVKIYWWRKSSWCWPYKRSKHVYVN
jgi:hypothetical protein